MWRLQVRVRYLGGSGRAATAFLSAAVPDQPPVLTTTVLQQYLTMLGSTVLIPFLIVPAMGGTEDDKARVISTIFFISGLITLLQTIVGDRLPIIQVAALH